MIFESLKKNMYIIRRRRSHRAGEIPNLTGKIYQKNSSITIEYQVEMFVDTFIFWLISKRYKIDNFEP